MRQKLLIFEEFRVEEVKVFFAVGCLKEGIVFTFHFVSYHVIELSFEPTSVDSLFSSELDTEIGDKTFLSDLEKIFNKIGSWNSNVFVKAFVKGINDFV